MTAGANVTPLVPTTEQLHAGFLSLLPAIQTHAQITFRNVRCPGRREDCQAETIALAWHWYRRLVLRGKDPSTFVTTLASFATRQVRCHRRLARSDSARDALSPLAQTRHGFVVQSLPEHDTGVSENVALDALKDNTITPPPEQAAFRCDFPRFLASLGDFKRAIAEDLMVGERTQNAARKHGVSQGRISQIRTELMRRWRRFHGELVNA